MKSKSIFITSSIGMLLTLIYSAVALSHDELGVRPHHIDLPANPTAVMRAFSNGKLGDEVGVQNLAALPATTCANGFADIYPCDNVDLMAFMPLASIGATQSNDEANDIWGWSKTDATGTREFAIIGRVFGTSFVEITDPANPVFIGELDTHGRFGSPWRDIKVYQDHAYIVSEASRHGMQVFDLNELLVVVEADMPKLFQETAHYKGFGSAHNLVINEVSGFAYGVGTDKCSGGLEMVNIQNPVNPTDAGCFSSDGYTHDAQCVIYTGPDQVHQGKEICLASNEDSITIVDVTNKSIPTQLSRTTYPGSAYTHQGWLTEDQNYFLLDDELDEQNIPPQNTRTRVFDVSDLDMPSFEFSYDSNNRAIDHNQYVKGNYSYQANYRSGLRILDISNLANGSMFEAAYFDIYPDNDDAQFNGAWSNYPYFPSETVVVSGIEQGLFVLRPNLGPSDTPPSVAVTNPIEGATVSGNSLSVAAMASDDNGVTQVEFFADGASIGVVTSEPYSAVWDSTTVADGAHVVSATATDTIGQTSSDSKNVTVDNVTDLAMHVGDLDGNTTDGRGGRWNATVTITVHDDGEGSVSGSEVSGSWSAGATGTGSCFTDSVGQCQVGKTNINRNSSSAIFTVTGVSHENLTYADGVNHDVDSGSNGTFIEIQRP